MTGPDKINTLVTYFIQGAAPKPLPTGKPQLKINKGGLYKEVLQIAYNLRC